MKKSTPIEKVFETWTAITDNRVKIKESGDGQAGEALVSSSDGEKTYTVKWAGNQYSSSDNATFWQGYPGYPVIAVLMLQGKIPYDASEAALWKNINWTQQNKKFKNNYAEAVAEIANERGINLSHSYEEAARVMEALSGISIEIKRKIKI